MYTLHKIDHLYFVTHLVNLSYYKLPKDFVFEGESHDFWELIYVDQGEVEIAAGNTQYLLKAGELAFHCPNEYHNVVNHEHNSANILVIAFCCHSQHMKSLEHRILFLGPQEKQCLALISKEADTAYRHFDNVAPQIDLTKREDAPYGSDQIIETALEQLFIYICRRNENIRFEDRGIPTHHLHHHAELAAQAVSWLNDHLREKITLSILAEALNVSVSQIKRVFRDQLGTTVVAFLTDLRISEAKRLIREREYNFTQIAEAVGYDNIYYFSTQFKKQTGMTPTEYSRSVRQ